MIPFGIAALWGCSRRELTNQAKPWAEVYIEVDWSSFGTLPSGMTLMFYEQSAQEPLIQLTHNTTHEVVKLPEGSYDILLINRSIGEFSTLLFKGMNRFETIEIEAKSATSLWYEPTTTTEVVCTEPERLGVATYKKLEITKKMVQESMAGRERGERSYSKSIRLIPKSITPLTTVIVHVDGIQNAQSVRGALRRFARGYLPSEGRASTKECSYLLDKGWTKKVTSGDNTKGVIYKTFYSFGPTSEEEMKREEVELALSLLLIDNKTTMDYEFLVGDRVQRDRESATVEIVVGVQMGDGSFPEDNPIPLPDVTPETNLGGGIDAKVENWEEIIEIEIDILA